MRVSVRALVTLVAFVLGTTSASAVRAEPERPRSGSLSSDETARLARGETVVREQTLDRGERRYVGGVTYTVVEATAAELTALMDDVSTYTHVLPRTKRARHVGSDRGGTLIELVQGNSLYEATYTIRVRKSPHEMRFWLEPTRPHDIDDAWGFFRMEPFIGPSGEQRVLLTYGVLVDVGPGLVRELFEERVRAAMLSVPQLVRRYVAR